MNLANISQSPRIDLKILKTYTGSFSSLEFVVIRLSYDTLFEQLRNSSEDWRLKDYSLYTNLQLDYKFCHNFELSATSLKQCVSKLYSFYRYHSLENKCDRLGFGQYSNWEGHKFSVEQGPVIAKKHTALSWDLLESNTSYYYEIAEWANTNNIQLIVVTPPAHQSYYLSLERNQLQAMKDFGEKLDKTYPNCKYLYFLDDKEFSVEDFYDVDHLSPSGASKFTQKINQFISELKIKD